ncbi:Tol-Pal system peptidoglycan-associated lipoprotein PAL [hydrothermal vent metagenome]|uniref:Tol-Pal system peptidoglycan-associated lipoprotein PAL n=1 Tax=hydrothermal vent metagenome TaxID=652676 RepID=A0A3B0XCT8_9ZZZZ
MKKLFLISVLAIFITACGDRIKPDDEAAANDSNQAANTKDGAAAGGINDGSGIGGTALEGGKLVSYEKNAIDDPNNVLSEKIVYFSYDSNAVADEDIELVKHHGKYLSFNADASVRLEGHADERGTREYNIALAEKRAQAVKQLMLYEGAANDQISIISYGEEKPVAFGHDDESMSLNRRVEIVY